MKYNELPKWLQTIAKIRSNLGDTIGNDYSLSSMFTFERTPEGHDFWLKVHSGKIPEPSTYVKVGDWVKIIRSDDNWVSQMDKFVDRIVQITAINNGGYKPSVRFHGSEHFNFCIQDGHFVKAFPTEIKESGFDKEDQVQVFKNGKAGKCGFVEDLINSDNEYGIRFKDRTWSRVHKDDLISITKQESPKPSEIVVGSKVRLSSEGKTKYDNDGFNPHDEEGEVIVERDSVYAYRVQWKEYTNSYMKDEIELVPEFGGDFSNLAIGTGGNQELVKEAKSLFLETTIELIHKQELKKYSQSNNNKNDIFRKTYSITRGTGPTENQVCSKISFAPIGSRY